MARQIDSPWQPAPLEHVQHYLSGTAFANRMTCLDVGNNGKHERITLGDGRFIVIS